MVWSVQAMGLTAELRGRGDELVLTIRNESGQRIAVVEGSADYIERALSALRRLPAPVRVFTEDRDGWQGPFIGSEPAHRHAKSAC